MFRHRGLYYLWRDWVCLFQQTSFLVFHVRFWKETFSLARCPRSVKYNSPSRLVTSLKGLGLSISTDVFSCPPCSLLKRTFSFSFRGKQYLEQYLEKPWQYLERYCLPLWHESKDEHEWWFVHVAFSRCLWSVKNYMPARHERPWWWSVLYYLPTRREFRKMWMVAFTSIHMMSDVASVVGLLGS